MIIFLFPVDFLIAVIGSEEQVYGEGGGEIPSLHLSASGLGLWRAHCLGSRVSTHLVADLD